MSFSLDDLRSAANALRVAQSRLTRALVEQDVRAFIRARVGDTAVDILDALVLLEEAQPAAVAATEEEARRLFSAMPIRIPPPESQGWSLEEHAAWLAEQPLPTSEQWAEAVRVLRVK